MHPRTDGNDVTAGGGSAVQRIAADLSKQDADWTEHGSRPGPLNFDGVGTNATPLRAKLTGSARAPGAHGGCFQVTEQDVCPQDDFGD